MIRRSLALFVLSLPLVACDDGSPENSTLRRGQDAAADSGRDGEDSYRDGEMACAAFLDSLLDDLRDSPFAPSWAYSDVTPGGLIGLAGGSVGIGDGPVTSIGDLPRMCAAIEAELGLPVGYLQPGTESIPGGYVEGCACTDCGMAPDAEGLDTFDSIGLGDSVSPHEIYNPRQLVDLAEAEPAWSRHYVQCTDIDLEPYYTSGGDEFNIATEGVAFTGVYDGGEHEIDGFATETLGGLFDSLQGTIRDLSLRGTAAVSDGDFGALVNIATGSELSNIRVLDPYFDFAQSSARVGGVAGRIIGSYAVGIDVVDPVFGGSGSYTRIGGVVGELENSTLSDAVVSNPQMDVPSARAGGLVSESVKSTVVDSWVDGGLLRVSAGGGAAALIQGSSFTNVETTTEIWCHTCGGFAYGVQQWTFQEESTVISDCFAGGDILPGNGLDGPPGGDKGGFLGWFQGGTIQRSGSAGDVVYRTSDTSSWEANTGGFVGTLNALHDIHIVDAFALGNIDRALGSTAQDDVGGFVGQILALEGATTTVDISSSFAAGNPEGVTTGAFVGSVDIEGVTITESFAIGHHNGTGGCFIGEGTINENGNNYVADLPCACTLEAGVSTAPTADFDQPNDNLGFAWSTDVWAFSDGALPSLQ